MQLSSLWGHPSSLAARVSNGEPCGYSSSAGNPANWTHPVLLGAEGCQGNTGNEINQNQELERKLEDVGTTPTQQPPPRTIPPAGRASQGTPGCGSQGPSPRAVGRTDLQLRYWLTWGINRQFSVCPLLTREDASALGDACRGLKGQVPEPSKDGQLGKFLMYKDEERVPRI